MTNFGAHNTPLPRFYQCIIVYIYIVIHIIHILSALSSHSCSLPGDPGVARHVRRFRSSDSHPRRPGCFSGKWGRTRATTRSIARLTDSALADADEMSRIGWDLTGRVQDDKDDDMS